MPGPEDPSWRFSSSGQFASQEYLTDEIARLNIVSNDTDRTEPSQSSKPISSVQFQDSTPLDSTSLASFDSSASDSHSRSSSSGAVRVGSHVVSPEVRSAGGQPSADHGLRQATNGSQQEQPSYPSLSNAQRANNQKFNPSSAQPNGRSGYRGGAPGSGSFGARTNQYRVPQQIQVGVPQQGLIPSPTTLGYPASHNGHLSLGTPQQLYDMMVPVDPAVARQQQGTLRGSHQHSTSDLATLHDQAQMNSFNTPMFTPPMTGPLSVYTNQYYPNQDAYRADLAAQTQAMLAARLQQQYNSQFSATSPPSSADKSMVSPSSSSGGNGPSANNRKLGLYKTELCRSWEEKHTCRYGAKCQFAHGEEELRNVPRHPKYKTEICRTFWVSGSCPYGKRCCFIHTELPHAANAANGAGNQPANAVNDAVKSPGVDGRARSSSDSSDPNDAPKSLLARISTGRDSGSNSNSATPTPVDTSSSSNFPFSRPPTGTLRVDTKSLDGQAYKTQNKSAFPVFPQANGRSVQPAPEPATAKSPVPVTAGPDFGRHNAARIDIVGQNNRVRSGTPSNGSHSYTNSTDDGSSSNHQRASSGTNWRARDNANYPASPATENISSPWTTQELVSGSSRQRPW